MARRQHPLDRITTTIKRQWLAEIIAGTKRIEYREIKPYWRERLERVAVPFELRLINGYTKNPPEALLRIERVRTNKREGVYELHIGKVLSYANWSKRRQAPA